MGKPIIWSGTNAKLINSGDLVDKNGNSLTNGGKVNYTWTSHGLSKPADIGRPVYVVSGTQLALADNTAAANAEVVGFVYDVLDSNTLRISFGGNCPAVGSNVLEGGGSLTAGTVYFLSSTAGKITATEPTTIGYISKPLAVATGTASLMFINYRGSTVGSTNARTQINLSNNSTTNMQNCASYDAGSIEGWVYIDATTDYRFYFNAPFAKIGAGTDYYISPSYVGDTPPAGFSITINSSGQTIVTLPNISGFVSATCTYSLNAPAVGTNFPLAIDGSQITGGTVGSTYLPVASASASGIINTSAQTLAGAKTFNNGIVFTGNGTQTNLNWYEEGSWTPVMQGGATAGTGTYTSQFGTFTRIGRMVFIQVQIGWTAHTGTGAMLITFPYTVNGSYKYSTNIIDYQTLTVSGTAFIETQPGQTYGIILSSPTAGGSCAAITLDTAATLFFSLNYMV